MEDSFSCQFWLKSIELLRKYEKILIFCYRLFGHNTLPICRFYQFNINISKNTNITSIKLYFKEKNLKIKIWNHQNWAKLTGSKGGCQNPVAWLFYKRSCVHLNISNRIFWNYRINGNNYTICLYFAAFHSMKEN